MSIDWPGLHEWQAALTEIAGKVDKASNAAIIELQSLAEKGAKDNFQGSHRKGRPHVGGAQPNVVTGNLRRSIQRSPVIRHGVGDYEASVYPTAIYARAVEMGNPKTGSRAFPYFGPSMRVVRSRANEILTAHWSKHI